MIDIVFRGLFRRVNQLPWIDRRVQPFELIVVLVMCLSVIGCGRNQRTNKESASRNEATTHDDSPAKMGLHVGELSALPIQSSTKRASQYRDLMDPTKDGWKSEKISGQAKKRFLQLLQMCQKTVQRKELESLLDLDCQLESDPTEFELVFSDSGLQVYRSSSQKTSPALQALSRLLARVSQVGATQLFVKVVGIELDSDRAHTSIRYEAEASGADGSIQQTAEFECVWNLTSESPVLSKIQCADFEEVRLQSPHGRAFSDCTESVFGGNSFYKEQLAYGINYWSSRIELAHGMDDSVRNGLAIGDVNGDGLDDVYVCQGPGLPNLLLIQQLDGTVEDVSRQAGVDFLDQTSSALILDLDNDGDQDLAVATTGGLVILQNDSTAHFKICSTLGSKRCDPQSLTAADYDNDGLLDLFLCVYRPDQVGRRGDFVFHDATTGGSNRLFHNDGDLQFSETTKEAGVDPGATRYSLASAWEDFDNDSDQDLYVANDYGRNFLYRNDDGQFVDVTQEVGLSDTGFGMSCSWGDPNRDAQMDLYIGNMFSSAGNRITNQQRFQQHATTVQRSTYQRMAKGNSLFLQREGKFDDVSRDSQTQMGRWAWSSVFCDLNNDAWEDVLVANGYITAEVASDL